MKKIKLGIVGSGYIAKFHHEAFKFIGYNPTFLVSSNSSKTAKSFAAKHSIPKIIREDDFLLQKKKDVDGLIIACTTDQAEKYIKWCIKNEVWALVEKPVSFNIKKIKSFLNYKKCIVAFNRRYYPNVNYLKNEIKNSKKKKIFLELNLPESTNKNKKFGYPLHKVFSNCVHGIDLINYICNKPLKIKKIDKVISNGSRIVSASNNKFDVRINFYINSPTNFSLKVYGLNNFFDLTPFEILKIYNHLEIRLPSKSYPVARYVPRVNKIINCFYKSNPKIKPGFLDQAKAFIKCLKNNKKDKNLPSIKDALNAQKFLQISFKDVL